MKTLDDVKAKLKAFEKSPFWKDESSKTANMLSDFIDADDVSMLLDWIDRLRAEHDALKAKVLHVAHNLGGVSDPLQKQLDDAIGYERGREHK